LRLEIRRLEELEVFSSLRLSIVVAAEVLTDVLTDVLIDVTADVIVTVESGIRQEED
jgi:hypothetical protein